MLDVLDKHKIIGGSKGLNTLTYLETTDEDFNEGELNGVLVEDNKLQSYSYDTDEDCLLYLKGNLPCTDLSPNQVPITCTGTETTGKYDKGIDCSSNKYIILKKDIIFEAEEDFTISITLNRLSTEKSNNRWLFSAPVSSSYNNYFRWLLCSTSNQMGITLNGSTSINITSSIDELLPPGIWRTLTLTRRDGKVYLYVDTTLLNSVSFTGKLSILSNTHLGNWCTSYNAHYSNTIICNVLITKKSLLIVDTEFTKKSQGYRISPQITTPRNLVSAKCNWEGEGKVSTYQYTKKHGIDENTVLYLKGEDFTDSSLYQKPITNVGATINSNGKVNKGIELAKTRINIDRGMEGVDLSKDFTIDWWEYSTGATTTTGSGLILNRTVTNSNYARCFLIGHKGTQLYAGTSSATTSWNIFSGVDVKDKVDNVWVHWAFVKKGTKYTTYKNGVKFWTATNSSVFGALEGDKLCLGAWINNTNIDMGYNAIIDNFRISNIARWETDFTPPEKDYELDEELITPLEKGKTITSLPNPIQLIEEVEGEETISNVSLEMKYGLKDTSTVPKEEGEDNTFYLYNEGDECTDITGGWKNGEFMNLSNTSWLVSAYAIKNTNNLEYGDNNANGTWYGYGGFITNSKVDLTPYSKMFIDWEMYQASVTTYNGGSGNVVNAIAYSDSTSVKVDKGLTQLASIVSKQGAYNTNRVVTEIDISNISGQKHICVNGQAGYINTDLVKNRTYNIWLEK